VLGLRSTPEPKAEGAVHQLMRGLAQALDTTADYLLGLTNARHPDAMAFARRYGLADEEQLLI
jgi:hypothetical protein